MIDEALELATQIDETDLISAVQQVTAATIQEEMTEKLMTEK